MKQTILFLVLYVSWSSFSQEKIYPLKVNPSLYKGNTQLMAKSDNAGIDSTFVYKIDTIDLPFFDDFSIDKFEKYDAKFTDPDVTDEWFYKLMDETNTTPLASTISLCDSAWSRHDTVVITDGVTTVETSYPFTGIDVWENKLDFYPVVGQIRTLHEECYVLIDSIIDGVPDTDQDTLFFEANFTQDSANVFTKTISDNGKVWIDNDVYRNYSYAIDPWSLGVATFDGVGPNGMPYEFGNESSFGIADHLTSKPIDLSSVPVGELVKLTFLYQAKGFGNMPEPIDSLILEVWDVDNAEWKRTGWFASTADVLPNQWDTAFYFVEADHRRNGFQFRFKNYASLSGALDHWHIDYVNLEATDIAAIEPFNDLAIVYPVHTLLKDYTSVPWKHYKNTTGNEKMRSAFFQPTYNSSLADIGFAPGEVKFFRDETLEYNYGTVVTGGADGSNYGLALYPCNVDVDPSFFFDQSIAEDQVEYDIKINISETVESENQYLVNDTTWLKQKFSNYYSYDDGSAEAAYGIEGTGALMAYKFDAYESGELLGILMHFVPTVVNLEDEIFLLTVWSDNGGEPGEIIYQDDYFTAHTPNYAGTREGFTYYSFTNEAYLTDGKLPVGETFYVGWQNIASHSLNIGLDWNIPNADKVFRNVSGSWLTSSYDMSLMIRPVFSTPLDDLFLGISTDEVEKAEQPITIYPNPTSHSFSVDGVPSQSQIEIHDLSGRIVLQTRNGQNIQVETLKKGVYIVVVRNELGEQYYTTKLIKQ